MAGVGVSPARGARKAFTPGSPTRSVPAAGNNLRECQAQRPYLHGKYHRARDGSATGTGSYPCVPPGRQRVIRASPIQPPGQKPKRQMASRVYSLHVGACRQVRPVKAESV